MVNIAAFRRALNFFRNQRISISILLHYMRCKSCEKNRMPCRALCLLILLLDDSVHFVVGCSGDEVDSVLTGLRDYFCLDGIREGLGVRNGGD